MTIFYVDTDHIPTIYADFNAMTTDDRVRLDTEGSRQSLAKIDIRSGMSAWLSDGEVRFVGLIEESTHGLVARLLR